MSGTCEAPICSVTCGGASRRSLHCGLCKCELLLAFFCCPHQFLHFTDFQYTENHKITEQGNTLMSQNPPSVPNNLFFFLDISPSDLQALKVPSVFLLTSFNGSFPAAFVAIQVAINQLLLIQICFLPSCSVDLSRF